MSEEDLEMLITLDDPGEDELEDTFHHEAPKHSLVDDCIHEGLIVKDHE